ncbi:MAG: diguanylate cyclase [Spongiibacteraceae bacterium]|nr:diguanylate cyclase [Spongiibacteraceae bacterium]
MRQGHGAGLLVWWGAVAAGYGGLILLSLFLAAPHSAVAPFWLPAGFGLAAVLQLGYRVWPGIALGAALTPLLLDGVPTAMAWLAPGAVAETLAGAWLIRRWVQSPVPLSHVSDIMRAILAVAIVTLPVAVTECVLTGGAADSPALPEWWLANIGGALLFAPFVLAWANRAYAPPPGRGTELALLAVVVLLTGDQVFGGTLASGSLEFILLVFFIWAALRLEVRGMTSLTLITGLVAAYHTGRGHGPLIAPDDLVTQLTLQGFAVSSTVTGLILIAATHERREALEELQLAARVIDNTPDGVMITDADLRIRSINPAFSATTGYSEAEVLGQTPRLLASGRHDAAFYQTMWRQIEQDGRWQGEIWNRRKSGEIYLEWLNIIAIRDAQGKVLHYAGIFSDVITQEHVRQRLHSLAYYDALTDLPNRELFHDRLYNALAQARRERHQLALLFLDVDHFKPINDTHGHAMGDRLLRVLAEELRRCVRESDTVARLGGDEFTILLTRVSGQADAVQVADKIIAAFARPFLVDGHALSVGVSIGIALFPDDAADEVMLLRDADAAMYAAKQAGRNNYQRYRPHMAALFSAERCPEMTRRG